MCEEVLMPLDLKYLRLQFSANLAQENKSDVKNGYRVVEACLIKESQQLLWASRTKAERA